MATASEIFGGNSDGGMRMLDWLDVMCKGCLRGHPEDGHEGYGCEIPARAMLDPYTADIPEWSVDATWPARFEGEFEPGDPWPVCLAHEPRKTRSDKGLRRGPRPPDGQLALDTGGPQ